METLLQFAVIVGVFAGLGAVLLRHDFRRGAICGAAIGLFAAACIYGAEEYAASIAHQKRVDEEIQESSDRLARELANDKAKLDETIRIQKERSAENDKRLYEVTHPHD